MDRIAVIRYSTSSWKLVLFVLSYFLDILNVKKVWRKGICAESSFYQFLVPRQPLCSIAGTYIGDMEGASAAHEEYEKILYNFSGVEEAIYELVRWEEMLNIGRIVLSL